MGVFALLNGLFRPAEPTEPAEPAQWLVVGLGNPGAKYAGNRHNVGYMVLDELERTGGVDGARLFKPGTFMNTAGEAVAPAARSLGLAPERVIVVHDELDLPAGTVRVKLGGNENGHNGLKSVTQHLGTRDYPRVRVGIGRPPKGTAVPDWVLANVSGENPDPDGQIELAAEAVRLIVAGGVARAQNVVHAK